MRVIVVTAKIRLFFEFTKRNDAFPAKVHFDDIYSLFPPE